MSWLQDTSSDFFQASSSLTGGMIMLYLKTEKSVPSADHWDSGGKMDHLRVFLNVRLNLVFAVILGSTVAAPISAETFCVDKANDLVSTLATAAANGEADVIQVVQGTYLTPGAPFSYFTYEDFGLALLGGFAPLCASRTLDPTNTILDGQNANPVVDLTPDNNTGGDLLFQGFTVRNGNGTSFDPGGLSIGASAGYFGDVTVEFNIISGNHATSTAGGIFGGSDIGLTRIENNLIVNNSSIGGWGAGQITCNGPEFFITNNTIADNTAPADGGLMLSGVAPTWVANNIFWGNAGWDLHLGTMTPLLKHNAIGVLVGTPDPGSVNNLWADPSFAGGGDFHLLVSSAVINVGWNYPAGGLPAQDLEGKSRIQGSVVDMGAYESPVLFIDDFEEGDSSAWSVTVDGS